ncbi:MAG: TrkH family potassium uptake protein [Clostridia bacterium]
MNYGIIVRTIGRIMLIVAVLLLLPMFVSLIYGESLFWVYLVAIGLICAFSIPAQFFIKNKSKMYAKEGYIIVAGSWIFLSIFGCLPFFISGYIPSFVDAFFETVSGFTTTGSSILTEIESLPKSLLFWRSFTHWIGGMGVLVFALAVLPSRDGSAMHLMRAEAPGPKVGKLVSKMSSTARILYAIYLALTVLEFICLFLAGQPLYDSIVNAFATAGTGGFSVLNNSIGGYNSPAVEYIISIFMLLFGINFNLFYFILIKKFSQAFKSEELRWYLIIIVSAVAIITLNIYHLYGNIEVAFRNALFQVSSIITTTGFGTADFNAWPTLSQVLLVLIMFVGACAGSTGGGIKVSRIIILFKQSLREIKRILNPRNIIAVKMEGKPVSENVLSGVAFFIITYIFVVATSIILISIDGFDITTTVTSVIACINNIGPGLGEVGPTGNFSQFSDFSKIILSINMLIGRLELFPVLILFSRSTWIKR